MERGGTGEGVDGLDVEMVVVMNHLAQHLHGAVANSRRRHVLGGGSEAFLRLFHDGLEESVLIVMAVGYAVEVLQDAALHFRRGLVGKRHGELMFVGMIDGIAEQMCDEGGRKREGLS